MHLEACFDQDDHDGDVDDDDDDDDNDDDGDAGFVAPPSLGQLSHIGKVSSSVVSFPSSSHSKRKRRITVPFLFTLFDVGVGEKLHLGPHQVFASLKKKHKYMKQL